MLRGRKVHRPERARVGQCSKPFRTAGTFFKLAPTRWVFTKLQDRDLSGELLVIGADWSEGVQLHSRI